MDAYAIPREKEEERRSAIQKAMLGAAEVPLRSLEAARDVAKLCARAAVIGNVNARSDGGVGGMLAGAAARGAYYNVLINVRGLPDPSAGDDLARRAKGIADEAARYAEESARTVEGALDG